MTPARSAYLLKPFQKSDLIPAIEVAIGRFRELQVLSGEVDALGEQLEARKLIDRAKGLLIDECGLREQDAFTFIQRTAMSERSRMREVAERILDGTLRPMALGRHVVGTGLRCASPAPSVARPRALLEPHCGSC